MTTIISLESARSCGGAAELPIAIAGLVLVLVGSTSSSATESDFHTSPSEWSQPRLFHTEYRAEYDERLWIERLPRRSPPLIAASPNRAYGWSLFPEFDCEVGADGSRDCSGAATEVGVLIDTERDYLIGVQIVDRYPNFGLSLRWINEKLLWIRVWWGRVLGTDAVLDVESESFVYREMVHDGVQVFQQHQQDE